jgi:WD40 repeat protein
MISVEELDRWGKIDIQTDPLYPAIARRFPEVMLWGGEPGYESIQRLPSGGQRFIFAYVLLNGCHACDIAGYAHIGFDFDGTGRFLGAKLLRLTRPTKTRHQHPVKRVLIGTRSEVPKNAMRSIVTLPLVATLEGGLLNFSADGRFVATQIERDGNNYTTKIWKPNESQPLLTMDGRFGSFSSDSRFVMTSHYGSDFTQVFELYEIPSGHRLNTWRGWQFAGFSPDSRFIIADAGYRDGKPITEFWSIEQGQRTRLLVNKTPAFSHDGKLMIFGDDGDPITSIVGSESNRPIRQLQGKFLWFSDDDRLIVTKEKAVLKIWQTATGELVSEVECWGDAYLSPDGEVVATEVFDYRRSKQNPIVKLSAVGSGKLLASIDGRLTSPYYPFLKSGKLIVTDLTNSIRSVTKVWDSEKGQLIALLEGGFRGFSSDGQLAMTEIWWKGPEHTTKLWRAENGGLFANVEGYPMGFSPDSQFVFTGSKSVKVWQLH